MTTIAHPKSYKLQWLNEAGPIKFKDQVNIPFSIGKYKDEVLNDIIPMDASHILLGRPWKFDRQAIYNELTNKICLVHLGKKYTLTPLSPYKSQFSIKHSIKQCLLVEKPFYLLYSKETLATISFELKSLPNGVQNLLQEFENLPPQEVPSGLPPLRGIEHQIDLVSRASLPKKFSYKTNPQEIKEIETQSPYVVLILLVPEKDSTWRMYIDFRVINNITIKYRYSIPWLDDMLDELRVALIFSKIDLKNGYHQIRIKKGDK
uniref:Transposon Ty3-G Gag-Pol polyprotein n=1 Tax=Cajanus cajan TaxID=3821 RepID=A0A151TPP2_CAJCA|nr:Transposon Ty3-G Gag-Pol polyprotein [Cajanus cajan]